MNKLVIGILVSLLFLSACSVLNKSAKSDTSISSNKDILDYCAQDNSYNSLYMSKIASTIMIGDEKYEAKLSVFYIPDSVIFFTASNTGFEIIRGAIYPDSTLIINRLEKTVYVDRYNFNSEDLISFDDVELLLNKNLLCSKLHELVYENENINLDYSSQNVKRKIFWNQYLSNISSFEFYQKKTDEYILGELTEDNDLKIYSDYIMGPMEIIAHGGIIEYNRELSINLSVNRAKYSYFYLR